MHELLQAGVRLPLAHQARAQIEVIVLQHDQRLAARCLSRGDDLIREQLVDDDIAVSQASQISFVMSGVRGVSHR